MKPFLPLILSVITILFLSPSCEEKKKCSCRELEDCIDGQCILKENCYYLNNKGIEGVNLYHGVVEGNSCVDTLVLDVDLDHPSPFYQFRLYADVAPWGTYNVEPEVITKLSDNEYTLSSLSAICRTGGGLNDYWYASLIHCTLFPDSVLMDIKFRWSLDTWPGGFVDSCQVTLYK